MSDLGAFFAMGGYGAYLWPAYGVAIGLVLAIWILAERRAGRARRDLARAQEAAPGPRS